MKQLTQKLKNGQMQVLEVPLPMLNPGMILVQNHYSLISAGTEASTVTAARESMIGKARSRPSQVKQALEMLKQQGPVQTYRAVMKKLDAYSPLGYSASGEVIELAPDIKEFAVGDMVACGGGGYASHAEVISAPKNLCVKLPRDADMKTAAYNTLGAIALQGVRQADLKLGETCAVIGLGLIGQLTALILRASGIRVVGIDIDPGMVSLAQKNSVDLAFQRKEAGLVEKLNEYTEGIGADGVIITAATKSLDPINLAGALARKKGRVVVLGEVPTGFDREDYYKKELELRMSCSYGPGRYDLSYEEKGIDYPSAYVRWTENRNMRAFQELIHTGKIRLDYLTTHLFKLEEAPKAYDLILEKKEPFLGILIEYDAREPVQKEKIQIKDAPAPTPPSTPSIAFVGAGSYAMSYLLPNIPKDKKFLLKSVMTSSGTSSRTVAEKYGFESCTSNESDIFNNHDINTVFIATRHDTHAEYVLKALNAEKNIFVEKPLCLTLDELEEIKKTHSTYSTNPLMVGFNRRFSPLSEIIKEHFGSGPMSMLYRINAGAIPSGTWIQDNEIGGGRIIGEVCHFIDLLSYFNGSLPREVFASALPDPENLEDTVSINLNFENGSIGTILYFSNGSKSFFKEYVEIYKAGMTAVLKDFKELEIYAKGKKIRKKFLSQDKGQKKMVNDFLNSVVEGNGAPIGFEDIYAVTLTTFKIIESLRNKRMMQVC